jgi:hypothetical protein
MGDDQRLLLVFFWHERSGPARRMDSLLAHIARKERARLRVTRVDVDDRPELARRFGVEDVPSLVLVCGRRVVDRLDGRASAPSIERMLEPHLKLAPARSGGRRRVNPVGPRPGTRDVRPTDGEEEGCDGERLSSWSRWRRRSDPQGSPRWPWRRAAAATSPASG